MEQQGICRAHTNIALIKYWGKRDEELILPYNSNLSLTLDRLYTDTEVTFDAGLDRDCFILDGQLRSQGETERVSAFLDLFRREAGTSWRARVRSVNHVPTAAGLASSASAFAALAGACREALGLRIDDTALSRFARQGSGSACRSVFGGFVKWEKGTDSASSFAQPLDAADWDIGMVILVLTREEKKISSRAGMKHTVETSAFYSLWPQTAESDLAEMERAIQERDVDGIGRIAERNALRMHATMLAADPPFSYFSPDSFLAMDRIRQLREEGLSAYFTMDAGPNLKIICPYSQAQTIADQLGRYYRADQLIISRPGPGIQTLSRLEESL